MKRRERRRVIGPVYAAAVLSLAYLLCLRSLPPPAPAVRAEMLAASRLMARATRAVRDCRVAAGIAVDLAADLNGTGLIGRERSVITTSLGSLEAKRTSANPNFAGLVVFLLREAGVRRGDAVAVGASSSFPAFIIATLSAAAAMGVEPVVISSLGSSEWGANVPEFNWADMEDCLRAAGAFDFRPVARAVGGDEDVGRDMDPAGRERLAARLRTGGVPVIEEPSLERNVARRMELYRRGAGPRPLKAFVNIGGSWANIGTNPEMLKLRPGLASDVFIPPAAERGVLQAMAATGVQVIHLLNVKGLCERYGLPWDPRPLPAPGEGRIYRDAAARSLPAAALSAGYVLAIVLALALARRRPSMNSPKWGNERLTSPGLRTDNGPTG